MRNSTRRPPADTRKHARSVALRGCVRVSCVLCVSRSVHVVVRPRIVPSSSALCASRCGWDRVRSARMPRAQRRRCVGWCACVPVGLLRHAVRSLQCAVLCAALCVPGGRCLLVPLLCGVRSVVGEACARRAVAGCCVRCVDGGGHAWGTVGAALVCAGNSGAGRWRTSVGGGCRAVRRGSGESATVCCAWHARRRGRPNETTVSAVSAGCKAEHEKRAQSGKQRTTIHHSHVTQHNRAVRASEASMDQVENEICTLHSVMSIND